MLEITGPDHKRQDLSTISFGKSGLAGGLCPNGFNSKDFVPGQVAWLHWAVCTDWPGSDPTGEQGCVYTYGTAKVVKLDDVASWLRCYACHAFSVTGCCSQLQVGITQEKCGKQLCKDWLDFRFNCSNGASLAFFTLQHSHALYCFLFGVSRGRDSHMS